MPLYSFCQLLTLQVGTAILASVFFAIAFLVAAVNIFDFHNHPNNEFPIPLILIVGFAVLMVVSGIIMFLAAYQESRTLCMVAVISVVLLTTYWVVLCCFSFANRPKDLRRVCIYHRCAESFWLADLRYKIIEQRGNKTAFDSYKTSHSDFNSIDPFYKDNLESEYNTVQSVNSRSSFSSREVYEKEEAESDDAESKYEFGLPMIGAITFFIANFLFFMFTILILWSYAQELKWADFYDPQTSYVVENT
uniref:Uncharacterized protein n=1 Tax=Cuerna arida TaxID=1464854 RepID=A0A1B6F6Y1_9HEMI